MRLQGYLEIDYQYMTSEECSNFDASIRQYMADYYKVGSGDREYYHCILMDQSTISGALEYLTDRNPIINGLWCEDGTVYSGAGEVSFDLDMHLLHSPTVSGSPATCFCPLHGFSGWTCCCSY